jgi:hypothetical protein
MRSPPTVGRYADADIGSAPQLLSWSCVRTTPTGGLPTIYRYGQIYLLDNPLSGTAAPGPGHRSASD